MSNDTTEKKTTYGYPDLLKALEQEYASEKPRGQTENHSVYDYLCRGPWDSPIL